MYASNYITNFQDCVDWMLKCYPNEGAGIVTTDNRFVAIANDAANPLNSFSFSTAAVLETHQVKAIIHSHTYDPNDEEALRVMMDPRIPSKADLTGYLELNKMASQFYGKETNIEWGIVICEGQNVTEPTWFGNYDHRPDLMDREFIHSIQDCLEFMKDWQYKEYGLKLPIFPRTYDWFMEGELEDGTHRPAENHFEEQYEKWGFVDVSHLPQARGDVVFYKIRASVTNHIGVIVQPNLVAHHLYSRLPVTEPFAIWAKYNTKRIRHKTNPAYTGEKQ